MKKDVIFLSKASYIENEKSNTPFTTPEGLEGIYLGDVGDDLNQLCYVIYDYPEMRLLQREYKRRVIFEVK